MIIDSQQQQAILARFHNDGAFRQRLLADANRAIEEEFGLALPFPLRVVQDGEGYLVEPIPGGGGDLSDEQLELAAGGKGGGGSPVGSGRPGAGLIGERGNGIISDHGGGFWFR
jgi:hypothetical protein